MPSVDLRNLGVVEYTDALELMSTLQQQRINNEIPDTILFLEHPEIVTVGPRARNDGIAPPSDYRSHPVDRGGGLTWHGPGQLVVYPIIHWNKDDEKSALELLSTGVKLVDKSIKPSELAAWTSVSRAMLNLYETTARF